jgi:signal transduction histidine kinase
MIEYLQKLFESAGFMPHGHCYFWRPEILITNVVGDGLTAFAYFSIPPTLFYLARKRDDLSHKSIIFLFVLFILACGATHLIEIVTVWNPVYRVQGVVKLITGLLSIATAIVLYRALPAIIALPGNNRLSVLNSKLLDEVAERERAQIALRQANEALETRVQQRTAQLIKINRELEKEIDIRKKAEGDLTEKNLELVRINLDLDNFVFCASHDLKAPIINIEGLVTALKEELPHPSEHVNAILDRLDGSLLKVDRTILDLTEVSRLQKAAEEMPCEHVYFAQVLDEVKEDINDLIEKSGAVLETNFSQAETVCLSHQNLKSIIYNLLSNAIQYGHPERQPKVFIQTSITEKCIILNISDNGQGIDLAKHEQKIFSLFRRLNDQVDGSGIGLYIVKRILDNINGRIKVKSTVGEGSTFEVYIPKRDC